MTNYDPTFNIALMARDRNKTWKLMELGDVSIRRFPFYTIFNVPGRVLIDCS